MGALGGAAKLNQTTLSSITQEEARPLLFETATVPLLDPFPDSSGGALVESLTSLSSGLISFGFSENFILLSISNEL